MSRTRYRIYETEYPYFLTCTIVGRLPIFARRECAEIVLDSWRFLQANERLRIFGYVILENHLHMIASSPDLAKEIGDFKSFTARRIVDHLQDRHAETLLRQLGAEKAQHKNDRDYQVWQEGSHPKQIQSDEMMWQKLEYTHNNPVRRGYVDDPLHWRYSSARNYARQPAMIEVATDWM